MSPSTRTAIVATTAAALVVAAIATQRASAGYQADWSVTIDYTARYADGALGSVRNSANTVEALGCVVSHTVGSNTTLQCNATDRKGNTAMCITIDPALIQVALALDGDSTLSFHWNDTGHCTRIAVADGSFMAPKR